MKSTNTERGYIGLLLVLIIGMVFVLWQMGYIQMNQDKVEEAKEKPQEVIQNFKNDLEKAQEKAKERLDP